MNMKMSTAGAGFCAAVMAMAFQPAFPAPPPTTTAVLCDTPAGVVTPAESPVLRLRKGFSAEGATWLLADWTGRPVASGAWPSNGVLRLAPLPAGYYRLASRTAAGQDLRPTSLAVVDPDFEKPPRDSFFAAMTALPYVANARGGDYPWHGRDWMRVNADLLAVLGIPNAREIAIWPLEQKTREQRPAFTAAERHAHELLAARGIGIDPFFEKAPAWADVDKKLARDLKAIYDYSKWAVAELGDRASSWEYWNEPDIAYAPEAAWDYAATLKAAYLGMKAANPKMPVLHGAFCQPPFTSYNRLVYANGAARYSDVVNWHSYSPLNGIGPQVEGIRKNMAEAGIPDRAIWITELNTNQEGNSVEESVHRGCKAHSVEQELVLVEYVAKGEIAMMMAGVARTFYFILPGFNERQGAKDWGLTRRDGTVKPAYAALATLVHRVGAAMLAGEVSVGEGLKAYLFDHADGRQTLVCWAVSDMERTSREVRPQPLYARELRLPGGRGMVDVYDACGHRTAHDAARPLPVNRFATYVTGLAGLRADVPATRPGKVEIHAFPADEDPTVVVKVDNDPANFSLGANKTLAEMNVATGRVTVTVWNLDGVAKRGSLSVAGGTLLGLPPEIELPAWGKAVFATRLVPADPPSGAPVVRVCLDGVFGGRRITPLVMPVMATARLLAGTQVVTPEISDLSRWRRNDSAKEWKIAWDAQERAVRMDLAWAATNGDRWFYPRYALNLPKERCERPLVIEYEARMSQDKVENDVNFSHVMLVRPTGRLVYCEITSAGGGWERRRMVVPPEACAEPLVGLQFGCGPRGYAATFWLRDLKIRCLGPCVAEHPAAH